MGHYTNEVTAYVKGGMPIIARATIESDEFGDAVSDVTLFWSNTGKEITPKFEASLTGRDWAAIEKALME